MPAEIEKEPAYPIKDPASLSPWFSRWLILEVDYGTNIYKEYQNQ